MKLSHNIRHTFITSSFFLIFSLNVISLQAQNRAKFDLDQPFGWALCNSLIDTGSYNLKGGGTGGRTITLVSDGYDMRQQIADAIRDYDVIILDGSAGPFMVSKVMRLNDIKHRTIIGINGARVCTEFYCSPEIHQMLNNNNVLDQHTSALQEPVVLSNGNKVREPREAKIRQLLIDSRNDPDEEYREAGLFNFNRAEDIIFRNITLVGPGAIDVGGADLMTLSHSSKHIWIDHCEFVDGMDGNFDINSFSDFITISWCVFRYTERTYIHANTNLIGSSDNVTRNGEDNLNVTFANCIWDHGCDQRMPMVRFGTIHIMNCLYDCAGNSAAVNPRRNSEVFIDRCYFNKGVKNIFRQTDAKAYNFYKNYYAESFSQPADFGKVLIPYPYKGMPTRKVPSILRGKGGAGATLELVNERKTK